MFLLGQHHAMLQYNMALWGLFDIICNDYWKNYTSHIYAIAPKTSQFKIFLKLLIKLNLTYKASWLAEKEKGRTLGKIAIDPMWDLAFINVFINHIFYAGCLSFKCGTCIITFRVAFRLWLIRLDTHHFIICGTLTIFVKNK